MRRPEIERNLRRPAARGLSRPAKAVYEVLLACARSGTGHTQFEKGISDSQIARHIDYRYSMRSIQRGRRELVDVGLVVILAEGRGRDWTRYRMVLEAVGVEVEMWQARQAQMAAAVGGSSASLMTQEDWSLREPPEDGEPEETCSEPPADPASVSTLPRQDVVANTTSWNPATHARPQSFQDSPPLPVPGEGPSNPDDAPLRGPEHHLASGSAAAASPCPRAARRGRPCGNCRACGTNPRTQRRLLAAQQARTQVPAPPPMPERTAITERGAPMARAVLAELAARKAASQAALTEEFQPPPVASSAHPGAP